MSTSRVYLLCLFYAIPIMSHNNLLLSNGNIIEVSTYNLKVNTNIYKSIQVYRYIIKLLSSAIIVTYYIIKGHFRPYRPN